jgi:hypothetical protein
VKTLAALGIVTLLAAAGCATSSAPVKSYQREYLAKPSMTLESEEYEDIFRNHIRDSREGSTGGYGQAGGGCGCN